MKPSEEARLDHERLMAFRESYVTLLNASTEIVDGSHHRLVADGDEDEWEQLRGRLARDAGAAVAAYKRVGGGLLDLRRPVMTGIHPIVNWQASLDDYDVLKPRMILAAVESAIGTAQQRYEDAAQRERGLVGVIAAFLRWPRSLREAVGPEPGPRRAASALGVFGQIVVGTVVTAIGGAVATGIVAACVALWQVIVGE